MWSGCIWKLVSPWVPQHMWGTAEHHFYFKQEKYERVEEPKLGICVRTVDNTKKSCPETCKWKKKRICSGHGLFPPEAVIYLGQNPTLNHCVCFYGLSGFVCAPQPLKAVWGAADFSPNLGIVKPHRFLALEECLASHFWLLQRTWARRLIGSMQMSWGCVFVFVSLWWAGGGNGGCSHRFSTFSLTSSAAASVGCERSSRRLWISVYWIQFYF